LARTQLIGRAERVSADSPDLRWAAVALIIAAISFNAVLCFLNTRGVAISNVHVMMSEAVLISAALLACRNHLNLKHLSVLALITAYTVAISALRYASVPADGFDPKISRDLVIPVVFFLLGTGIDEVKAADKVVFTATAILLVFATFEYFFLDSFLRIFGVAEYYVARGTLEASDWALDVSQGLMVSGFRPTDQGRTLLSFLGDHRVSSLFLEPSSLGNFGTLVTIWAMVRSRMEGRLFLWCALGGLSLLVLSDTRFDAYFLILATLVLMMPPRLTTPVVFLLPFVTIAGLYILGATHAESFSAVPMVEGRGVYDRLLYSGRVLFDFDAYNWFGLESSRGQTFDSGYGYVISNVGIVGFAALWILFMSLQGANRFFYFFRNITALYFATMLCISASQFTIKIAALLWFLLGLLSVVKVTDGGSSQRLVDAN
jgi:putative polymerase